MDREKSRDRGGYWKMQKEMAERQTAEKKLERQRRPWESRKGNAGATRNWGLVTGVRWPRAGVEARVSS